MWLNEGPNGHITDPNNCENCQIIMRNLAKLLIVGATFTVALDKLADGRRIKAWGWAKELASEHFTSINAAPLTREFALLRDPLRGSRGAAQEDVALALLTGATY